MNDKDKRDLAIWGIVVGTSLTVLADWYLLKSSSSIPTNTTPESNTTITTPSNTPPNTTPNNDNEIPVIQPPEPSPEPSPPEPSPETPEPSGITFTVTGVIKNNSGQILANRDFIFESNTLPVINGKTTSNGYTVTKTESSIPITVVITDKESGESVSKIITAPGNYTMPNIVLFMARSPCSNDSECPTGFYCDSGNCTPGINPNSTKSPTNLIATVGGTSVGSQKYVTYSWTPPIDKSGIIAWRVYRSGKTPYNLSPVVTNTTSGDNNPGTYTVYITAITSSGETAPSNTVTFTVP